MTNRRNGANRSWLVGRCPPRLGTPQRGVGRQLQGPPVYPGPELLFLHYSLPPVPVRSPPRATHPSNGRRQTLVAAVVAEDGAVLHRQGLPRDLAAVGDQTVVVAVALVALLAVALVALLAVVLGILFVVMEAMMLLPLAAKSSKQRKSGDNSLCLQRMIQILLMCNRYPGWMAAGMCPRSKALQND